VSANLSGILPFRIYCMLESLYRAKPVEFDGFIRFCDSSVFIAIVRVLKLLKILIFVGIFTAFPRSTFVQEYRP